MNVTIKLCKTIQLSKNYHKWGPTGRNNGQERKGIKTDKG